MPFITTVLTQPPSNIQFAQDRALDYIYETNSNGIDFQSLSKYLTTYHINPTKVWYSCRKFTYKRYNRIVALYSSS